MSAPPHEAILTVSDLTARLRGALSTKFGEVCVRGEISQPRRPASGHLYLTLKDEGAVLPGVLWRSTVARLRFRPEEGLEVLARGGIDVYPPHGRYQLIIRKLEPLGAGALQLAFEQMRRRLEAEGLFDPARKLSLPPMPRRIALITSRTGAAVRDMVSVIRRRFPRVVILLLDVRVQGEGAAEEIARAVQVADRHARADVIVVGRGGGSLEDLWAFNEEVVARALAACRTPIVSAVGHETDLTIADLAADVRAATPSQAGELVVPDRAECVRRLRAEQTQLERRMRVRLERGWQRLEALGERPVLRTPAALLHVPKRAVAHLAGRLRACSPAARLRRQAEALAGQAGRLRPPVTRRLRAGREACAILETRLRHGARRAWERRDASVEALRLRLRALSPLAVLGRGYSLTTRLAASADAAGGVPAGGVLRKAEDVALGDLLRTQLSSGARVDSRVEAIDARDEEAAAKRGRS